MFLKDAEELTLPFLNHPGLDDLEKNNKRPGELLKKIEEAVQKMKFNPLGPPFTRLEPEIADAFRKYAKICEENLR